MEEATNSGVDVRKVEALVRQAKNSLDEGNFGESKLTAEKALALLGETSVNFTRAKDQIAEAQTVVDELRKRSVDVGQSDSLIQLAQSFLKTGNYEKAVAYAKKAIKTANEAQTRQATEKALGDKPPLPPAVAKPVDSGPVSDQKAAAASKPVILAVPKDAAAPGVPGVCPSCGEAVEPSWKRCPSCAAPLGAAPSPAGPAAAAGRAPAESPSPTQTSEAEAAAAESEIREVEKTLERMEKDGLNVAHARNLLKLAVSFLRGGSYEKATRYARKVKNVLEEKKGG